MDLVLHFLFFFRHHTRLLLCGFFSLHFFVDFGLKRLISLSLQLQELHEHSHLSRRLGHEHLIGLLFLEIHHQSYHLLRLFSSQFSHFIYFICLFRPLFQLLFLLVQFVDFVLQIRNLAASLSFGGIETVFSVFELRFQRLDLGVHLVLRLAQLQELVLAGFELVTQGESLGLTGL